MSKLSKIFKNVFSNLITTIIVVIILYIIFNIGRAVLANYHTNQKITDLESEISDIKEQNQLLENLNLYYQTESFKEIEARRKLGMKRPDEKMVVILENNEKNDENSKKQNEIETSKTEQLSNYLSWWYYVIGK